MSFHSNFVIFLSFLSTHTYVFVTYYIIVLYIKIGNLFCFKHHNLSNVIVESLHGLLLDAQMRLRGHLLDCVVLKIPHPVLVQQWGAGVTNGLDLHLREPFMLKSRFGLSLLYTLTKDASSSQSSVVTLQGSWLRTSQKDGLVKADVVLKQTHALVPYPAAPVAVAHGVLVVGVRVLNKVALHEVPTLLAIELEENVDAVQPERID